MHWYSWLLLALFTLCCLFLIGSVLLQSGKGDLASALGGGGAQTAFGPRSAASTLARVTLMAASGFMILGFLFSIPGILGGGSVASDLDKDPLAPKTTPTPIVSPAPTPAPPGAIPGVGPVTGETSPTPAASPATGKVEGTENKTDDKAKPATEGKKDAPKADASKDKKDNKDAKPENK